MALTREEILAAIAARRRETEPFNVPEWGGDVFIRRMTIDEAEATGLAEGKRNAAMFHRVIAAGVVNEDASPMFTEADAEALADIDVAVAARVLAQVMRINGLMDEELEKAVASFGNARTGSSSSS